MVAQDDIDRMLDSIEEAPFTVTVDTVHNKSVIIITSDSNYVNNPEINLRDFRVTLTINHDDNVVNSIKVEDNTTGQTVHEELGVYTWNLLPWTLEILDSISTYGIDGFYQTLHSFYETEQYFDDLNR